MIAYVDASVLLRVALGQPDALPDWRQTASRRRQCSRDDGVPADA